MPTKYEHWKFFLEIKPFEFATDQRAKQWEKIDEKKTAEQSENERKRLQLEAEKAKKEQEEIRQERKRREFHPKKRYHPYNLDKK